MWVFCYLGIEKQRLRLCEMKRTLEWHTEDTTREKKMYIVQNLFP